MSAKGFMDPRESVAMRLESMATEGYESITPGEMLEDFVARTPALTPGERADILTAALESGGAAEIDWGRTGADIQSWTQFGAGLANLAGNIAGAFGGQTGRDAQRVLQGIGGVGGALGNVAGGVMQQFGRPQPGQVPPIRRPTPGAPMPMSPPQGPAPGAPFPGAPFPGAPFQGPPTQGAPFAGGLLPPGFQFPGAPTGPTPAARPGTDATAMLQQLFGNPQLLQALAQGIVGGPTAPREVVLEIAGHEGTTEAVAIPLGAVMNAIATLATEAMVELNAQTHPAESEVPSYLLGQEGELIVDPANTEARAALVVDYFRRARQAERAGLVGGGEADWGDEAFGEGFDEDFDEDDEADESTDFGY